VVVLSARVPARPGRRGRAPGISRLRLELTRKLNPAAAASDDLGRERPYGAVYCGETDAVPADALELENPAKRCQSKWKCG
jgi:hypothetical protein